MSFNVTWAKVAGVVLLVIGVLGFFTGGTLWMFEVNALHNIVHLVTGALLAWAGFGAGGKNAQTYNRVLGIIYLLVAILGFANIAALVDLLALNAADNWLHLLIGIVTTAIGLWA